MSTCQLRAIGNSSTYTIYHIIITCDASTTVEYNEIIAVRVDLGGDAFTARMNYYLGLTIEIGEFGVAHVWFQCYEKGYFEQSLQNYFRH